jgi:exopolysaccharide biosynthesis polyprenyl glycosylphosphotransferase
LEEIAKCEIVFLTAGVTSKGRDSILLFAAQHGIGVYYVPEYRDIALMASSMEKTDDIPTFYISKLELSFEERFLKRSLDLIFGLLGFFIFLPFGLITAILVKLDGGPIFYRQERLTYNGRIFKVIKFRTMVPDAEKLSGPVLAGENDPRITKIGRFIRAVRLDEIPQVLNVLIGDMSIVGPRPERPFFTDKFEQQIPQYRQRLNVKAGLTGLAQIEGKYNTSFEDKLRYDLLYISRYSLFQDILIVLQTIKVLFAKESTEGV